MDMQTPVPAAGATATEPAIEAVVEPRMDVPIEPPIDAPAEPPLEFVVPEPRPVIPAGAPSLEEEYGYAQSRHERGDLAAAVESYRRVLDLDPNHHAARTRLASAYVALGRHVEAESELYLLRDIMGDDPLYLFTVALFDFEARRTREAHLALVRLLDREPDHVRGRLLLGSLFETGGDLERALLEYRHAHRLSPGDPATLYPFARALDAAGRRDEALSAYEQFLAAPVAAHPWLEVRDAVQQRVTWLRRS
jgi:predicted Zn-dependent protease